MSAVKPVLSPLTRCALETEAHVASEGWGQAPRLFALARNGELLRAQPALATVLGDIDRDEYSAIEQEDAIVGDDLEKALGHTAWPDDVEGVALAVERIIVPPSAQTDTFGTRGFTTERLASHAEREDVRLLVAALRGGEIITLVRRKAEDSDDKVAIGTNIAPGLVDALKATLAG
ncbi:PPA1309 family protein [Dermacoccus barathri]|uniref:PPA1309 family protein n=1 Tax=Dermacoccus barathri TaxID=322601 RepID=A0ABN2BWG0_9MICO